MKRLNDQGGFTLVELLVSLGMAAALITAVMIITFGFYGNIIIEGQNSRMTLESTQLLRTFSEQLRIASALRTTNANADANAPVGGWVTSDATNTIIIVTPAVDSVNDFVIDPVEAAPYQTEVIYFQQGTKLRRRYLVPSAATTSRLKTTCPTGSSACPLDATMTENFKDLTFTFYNVDNVVTTDATLARSVSITVSLSKKVAGKTLTQSNTVRMTLRNSL